LGAQEDLLAVDRGGGYMGWRYVFNLDGPKQMTSHSNKIM